MKETFFDRAFKIVLEDEGHEYTNDPADSGGPTKYGVTLSAYRAYVGAPLLQADAIENLSIESAKGFYYNCYWSPMGCEKLSRIEIAAALLDTSVLYGAGTASLQVQEALSACGFPLVMDGEIGEKTIAALQSVLLFKFLEQLRKSLIDRIDSIVKLHPKNEKFRHGWEERANRLLTLPNNPLLMETP